MAILAKKANIVIKTFMLIISRICLRPRVCGMTGLAFRVQLRSWLDHRMTSRNIHLERNYELKTWVSDCQTSVGVWATFKKDQKSKKVLFGIMFSQVSSQNNVAYHKVQSSTFQLITCTCHYFIKMSRSTFLKRFPFSYCQFLAICNNKARYFCLWA
jgi:hypothetical protein